MYNYILFNCSFAPVDRFFLGNVQFLFIFFCEPYIDLILVKFSVEPAFAHNIDAHTVCPRSSDPFYVVTYYLKWTTTAWTYSM